MQTESRGLWLLAAVAGWSLVAVAAALAGVGGRIALAPDDPALVPPLPQARRVAQAEPELVDRSEIAARPLFAPDRRPTVVDAPVAEAAPPLDLRLSGVILSGDTRLAILTDAQDHTRSWRVRVDQPLAGAPDWRLVELGPRNAVLLGPEGRSELELRIYEGQGGDPPTPMTMPTAQVDAMGDARRARREALARARAEREANEAAQQAADAAPAGVVPGSRPATPVVAPDVEAMPDPQEQAERIRQRIQERREQLRRQQQDAVNGGRNTNAQR
ncbi:hypothetical protein [Coralloluteibacterium thermophilus]|uniref:General secretion pathway protein GspN n=1 Tax=Coralloluteibacterium thermophilum TaxID=2707049 RepID=A0ABV9NLT8_9GAMM